MKLSVDFIPSGDADMLQINTATDTNNNAVLRDIITNFVCEQNEEICHCSLDLYNNN